MPLKDIEILGGTLYLNDEPIMRVDKCDLVCEETEQEIAKKILNGKPPEITITLKNVKTNRNTFLSLFHGRKVTNNWLKIHGGVMTRKRGRK